MNKQEDYPAIRLKYIIYCIALLVGICMTFIGIGFRPYYKLFINEEFIGYYKTYEEYEQLYNSIEKETKIDGVQEVKYLTTKPIYQMELVKEKYVKTFNNQNLIEQQMKKDYTVYKITVNEKDQLFFKTEKEANEVVKELKEEIKQSTKIEVKKIIIEDLSKISTKEQIKNKKEKIIKDNKITITVTSRGSTTRVSSSNAGYLWPTTSKTITSYFGARWGRNHNGIDIGVPLNSSVYAMRAGTVILAEWNGGYGYQVKIQHSNGVITTYAHNNKLLVKKGETVKKGQVIAKSGSTGNSTGPHLHVEFIVNGDFKNPLNYL